MKYISTQENSPALSFSEAIQRGLAPDNGLYVPEHFPQFDAIDSTLSFHQFASKVLKPFFLGDQLENQVEEICKSAFNFEIPLKQLDEKTFVLELFHGPTLAFKDVGARFLSECLNRVSSEKKLSILVATSGDTGSAVASAFYGKENINVAVLFPQGKISERQEKQIVCWDKNILPIAIEGTFDDCQKLVKSAFSHYWWNEHTQLTTANSINIGRLLPQMAYYAYSSSIYFSQHGEKANFIVPSGNVGNVSAAFWAKKCGFPIGNIRVSTNENRPIVDYLSSGTFHPRKSVSTVANAMDVGNPSNLERIIHLFPDFQQLKENVSAVAVSDEEIKETIQSVYHSYDYISCPHTATAFKIKSEKETEIIVSTADPCKFETVVEPIIKRNVEVKLQLKEMLTTQNKAEIIHPKMDEIIKIYSKSFL